VKPCVIVKTELRLPQMRSMRGVSDPRISLGVNAEMAFLMWSASEVCREAERVNARHDSGKAKERQPKIATVQGNLRRATLVQEYVIESWRF
jgi:hypothetical protein